VNDRLRQYLAKLPSIVADMQRDFPKKKFTLDGRLVGDIGEIVAEEIYDLTLIEGQPQLHDAVDGNGRRVQIKATMKDRLTFGDVPDYYLGLYIGTDGAVTEIFNGPGAVIWTQISHRVRPKNGQFQLSLPSLRRLQSVVEAKDNIARR
jgi:hypothetical protein